MNIAPERSVGVTRRRQQAHGPEQLMATADTHPPGPHSPDPHSQGILTARPTGNPAMMPASGTRPLGAGGKRDGLLCIPRVIAADRPAPLLVMLHGAGGAAANVMPMVADTAEAHGTVILAPDSRDVTWDVIHKDYGEDVAFLDRALAEVFRVCPIDPARIAIAGFSDGASYALSLGLLNGALFRGIIAFSPGFALPTQSEDRPAIFISHGREDPVLPIERCGRRIAVRLRSLGYAVDYREFVGGHVVPTEMVDAAFRRLLA
jgi:phospholipase/carboxylesterase